MLSRIPCTAVLLSLFLVISTQVIAQTVTDIDGNSYPTIEIGDQTWMQENLRVSRFNDGTSIPTTADPVNNDTSALYQWAYDLDSTNIPSFGLLYTWNVVRVNKNICPSGWHVPNNADWDSLISFLGGEAVAGAKLKTTDTAFWLTTDSLVTNSSNFSGVGAGFRGNPSMFNQIKEIGAFWSATPAGQIGTFPRGYVYRLSAYNTAMNTGLATGNVGNSIRCIKDVSTGIEHSDQQSNLKVYPNPTNGLIWLESEFILKGHMLIYDLEGQLVFTMDLDEQVTEIDLQELPSGEYLIQIEGEETQAQKRILILD